MRAVLHPLGPLMTMDPVTPPPSKANVEAVAPAGRPVAGVTSTVPSAGTDTVVAHHRRPGPRPRRSSRRGPVVRVVLVSTTTTVAPPPASRPAPLAQNSDEDRADAGATRDAVPRRDGGRRRRGRRGDRDDADPHQHGHRHHERRRPAGHRSLGPAASGQSGLDQRGRVPVWAASGTPSDGRTGVGPSEGPFRCRRVRSSEHPLLVHRPRVVELLVDPQPTLATTLRGRPTRSHSRRTRRRSTSAARTTPQASTENTPASSGHTPSSNRSVPVVAAGTA